MLADWFCGIRGRGLGVVLLVLSMVNRVEVSSGLRAVGTAVGDRSDVGAVALCLCFHLACSLSVRPSQKIGVGALYVNFCFAGWSIMVPFSAYQSVLSALDKSSQCSGFGGYERSWTGAPGRLRRRTSALFVDGVMDRGIRYLGLVVV